MKKTVDLIRLGIFVVLMSAIPILCNMYFGTPALNVSGMLENEDIITKIKIEILAPSVYDGYEISDKEDIETIIDFLNGVTKIKRYKNDSSTGSSGYGLKFYDQDGQIASIASVGNTFWSVDGVAWEGFYEEFLSFNRIMAEIIYKQYYDDVSYDCRKGKVKKVYNEDTHVTDDGGYELLKRKRICIIDTDDKKMDISGAYSFDFKRNKNFGSPKKGDQVEIYLKAGEENVKAVFLSPIGAE